MKPRTHYPSFIVALVAMFVCLLTISAEGQEAPPAPVAPPTATAAPAPAPTAPAPTATPAPAATRPEDRVTAPAPAPAPAAGGAAPPPKPNLLQRAAALLQTKEGQAQALAARDKTIADLRAENTTLKERLAGMAELEAAFAKIDGEQTTVAETVASLGFPPEKLPAPTATEAKKEAHAITSEDNNLAQLAALGLGGKK